MQVKIGTLNDLTLYPFLVHVPANQGMGHHVLAFVRDQGLEGE